MCFLNLCQYFEGSGQSLNLHADFSFSTTKQFPSWQVHFTGPCNQNVDYDVVLLYAVSLDIAL